MLIDHRACGHTKGVWTVRVPDAQASSVPGNATCVWSVFFGEEDGLTTGLLSRQQQSLGAGRKQGAREGAECRLRA